MRILKGISYDIYDVLVNDLTSRFAKCVIESEGGLLDVELSENVIVKCYDNRITLDLGRNFAFLDYDEFVEFTFH